VNRRLFLATFLGMAASVRAAGRVTVRRILRLKARLGLHRNRYVDPDLLPVKVASKAHLAQAALSYVRSRADRLGLPLHFYQKMDIHMHIPEGAIPKDGPSAGITMATSIVSALIKKPVKRKVAMTGEITLRGRVLPIGGLKEKLIAAQRGKVERVIIPKDNEKDLKDIPAKVLKAMEIIPVEHMDEVLKHALVLEDPETLFKPAPEAECTPFYLEERPKAPEMIAH
jgi:beta-glucosidase-like glycosyl hydrolase